jgi:hypothetical protein
VAEEGEMFLEEINRIRRKVDPTASKMMEMIWSDELATIATEYASECKAYLNPARNNQSTDFNEVGELHYVGRLKDAASFSSLLVDAVSFWNTSKLKNVTVSSLGILPEGNVSLSIVVTCHTRDYIQLTSENANKIGCGLAECSSLAFGPQLYFETQPEDTFLLVCNIGPTVSDSCHTNYSRGSPCSQCPPNTICKDGLCRTHSNNLATSLESCETRQVASSIVYDNQGSEYYLANGPAGLSYTVYLTTSEVYTISFTMLDTATGNLTTASVKPGEALTYYAFESASVYFTNLYLTHSIIIKSTSKKLHVFVEYTQFRRNDAFLALSKPIRTPSGDGEYQYIVVGDTPAIALTATSNCTHATMATFGSRSSLSAGKPELSEFMLQEGETMVKSNSDIYSTVITANKPISVLALSECTEGFGLVSGVYCVPFFRVEQILPVHEWGSQFAISHIGEWKNDPQYRRSQFRVISAEDDVSITVSCSHARNEIITEILSKKGKWSHFQFEGEFYCWIEGNGSISVIQYSDVGYDYFMTVVPSLQQYTNHYVLPPIQSNALLKADYINIYIPVPHFQPDQIFLDGTSLEELGMQFNPIWDNSGDAVAYVTTANFSDGKVHSLNHTKNLAQIGVVMYGASYALPGGLHNQIGDDDQGSSEEMQPKNETVLITVVMVVLLVALTVILVTGLLAAILLYWRQCRQKHKTIRMSVAMIPNPTATKQVGDEWEIDKSHFQIQEEIGSGNYGSVHRGYLTLSAKSEAVVNYQELMMHEGKSTVLVAAKTIKVQDGVESFLCEIEMMKKVSAGNNPHVVKMVGCVTLSSPVMLMVEYVSHGNLRDYLRECKTSSQRKSNARALSVTEHMGQTDTEENFGIGKHICFLNDADLLSFCYQISSGMEYLASLNIIHRDLACRNVLVDNNKLLKISDFGLARNSEAYVSGMKDKLPLRWMAPETCSEAIFTEQSDVWAFGIVLWEIHTYGNFLYEAAVGYKSCVVYKIHSLIHCNSTLNIVYKYTNI